MKTIYEFAVADIKRLFTSRLFFLSTLLPVVFTMLLITGQSFSKQELHFSEDMVKYLFFFYQYSIILISVSVATLEISGKTAGIVLSSLKNRRSLLYTKLITMAAYSLFSALFLYFSQVGAKWIEFEKIVDADLSVFINIWLKSSFLSIFVLLFAFFTVLFVWNRLFTLIIILVSFILDRTIVGILLHFQFNSLRNMYELTPLPLVVRIFQYNDYSAGSLLIIMSSSLLLILFTSIKIENMDIR